jgi:hypothetical protein
MLHLPPFVIVKERRSHALGTKASKSAGHFLGAPEKAGPHNLACQDVICMLLSMFINTVLTNKLLGTAF